MLTHDLKRMAYGNRKDTEEDKNHGWAKPNVIDKISDLHNQSLEFEKIIRDLPDRYKKGYPIRYMNDYAGDDNSLTHSSRMEGKIQANSESWGYVYLIESGGHYKIGKSNNYSKRFGHLKIQLPNKMTHICAYETENMNKMEFFYHHKFRLKRLNGEWFNLDRADIEYFMNNTPPRN